MLDFNLNSRRLIYSLIWLDSIDNDNMCTCVASKTITSSRLFSYLEVCLFFFFKRARIEFQKFYSTRIRAAYKFFT